MKIRRAIQVAPIKLAIFLLPIVLIARLSRAEMWCGDGPADYLDAETPEPVPAFACAKAVRDPSAPVASLPSVRMTKNTVAVLASVRMTDFWISRNR
jgi:hypothetical protein